MLRSFFQVLTRSDNAGSLIPPGLSSPPPLVPSEASVKKVRTPPRDEPAAEYLKSCVRLCSRVVVARLTLSRPRRRQGYRRLEVQ